MKNVLSTTFALVIVCFFGWLVYWVVSQVWGQFKLIDPKLSVGILTASTTVIVATLSVVLGKYMERKKDIESHYREKKIQIYDEFLSEFFKLFYSDDVQDPSDDNWALVGFLREWQRKMILWGGQDVLFKYIEWRKHLNNNTPDAKTMFLMEDFFKAMRADIGHKNTKLQKGSFFHLILQDADLFLKLAESKPDITFEEVEEIKKSLQQ